MTYVIYEAQTSLTVCGWNDQQWTAHAFADRYFDAENPLDDEFTYEGMQEDPVAWNSEVDAILLDANRPV